METDYTLPTTQGEVKMERYIEDLIRNKDFKRKLKRLRKAHEVIEGMYDEWPEDKKLEHDNINTEIGSILNEYEILRKRCRKLFENEYNKVMNAISEKYQLDGDQLAYIESLPPHGKRLKTFLSFMKSRAELDMCKIYNFNDEELNPANKGEEIIHLNGRRKLFLNAYPIGICIHPKASQRDVIDFIEKRWPWIENNFLRQYSEKKLKYGKKKTSQEILDFIWKNRNLKSMQIKEKLEREYPENNLAYFEINKIIHSEKEKD